MIIQVRGTSGSGKTTVMRSLMKALGGGKAVYRPGRKRPLYYRYPQGEIVLGHYESPCGGCDTIGSARAVYELIQGLRGEGVNGSILCEGLLLSEDTKWSRQLDNLRVVFLTTPTERCLEWVQQRRQAAGNTDVLNPTNTVNRVGIIEKARRKLLEAGILCRRASASQAPSIILNWLHAAKELRNGSGTVLD